ncbi:helix-turn-helix domain-containing protein, partial [Chloroflexota bacterium]
MFVKFVNCIFIGKVNAMSIIFAPTRESSIGPWARELRVSLQLTQQELADRAGISKEDVELLEHGLPMPLDIKNKLLKKLYAAKSASKCQL